MWPYPWCTWKVCVRILEKSRLFFTSQTLSQRLFFFFFRGESLAGVKAWCYYLVIVVFVRKRIGTPGCRCRTGWVCLVLHSWLIASLQWNEAGCQGSFMGDSSTVVLDFNGYALGQIGDDTTRPIRTHTHTHARTQNNSSWRHDEIPTQMAPQSVGTNIRRVPPHLCWHHLIPQALISGPP